MVFCYDENMIILVGNRKNHHDDKNMISAAKLLWLRSSSRFLWIFKGAARNDEESFQEV